MKSTRIFMCLPFLALVAGGIVYLLWRSTTLWMFGWCKALGLGSHLASLRTIAEQYEPPHWMLYSFPDGAWVFAGIMVMRDIWASGKGAMKSFWVFVIPFLAISSEVGQLYHFVPGDFDFNDLVAYVIAVSLALLIKLTSTQYDNAK